MDYAKESSKQDTTTTQNHSGCKSMKTKLNCQSFCGA